MFDLEKSIADWRRQMLAAGIKAPAPLEELEIHLREEVERQMNSGTSAQQAFEISARRIGRPHRLKAEFKRAGSMKETGEWWIARLILYSAGMAYCWVLLLGTNALLTVEMSSMQRSLGLAAVALSVMAIFGGRCICRVLPAIPDKRFRMAIQIGCFLPVMVWFPIYANVVLPRWDFNNFHLGALMVATLWTITLLAVTFRLWKGFDDAASRQLL